MSDRYSKVLARFVFNFISSNVEPEEHFVSPPLLLQAPTISQPPKYANWYTGNAVNTSVGLSDSPTRIFSAWHRKLPGPSL